MADHIAMSPDGGEKMSKLALCVAAMSPELLKALCATSEESAGENGEGLPFRRHPGGWSRRILDRSRASGKRGIESHVVDPAPITTSRRRRRAKTDGIDGEALVRALLAHKRGEPRGVRDGESADPEEEDRRRLCRERKVLIGEAGPAHPIASRGCLLFSQGISGHQPLRHDRRERLDTP